MPREASMPSNNLRRRRRRRRKRREKKEKKEKKDKEEEKEGSGSGIGLLWGGHVPKLMGQALPTATRV